MRWWQRTKRHGSRRDTGVKGREGGGERERGRARRGRRWTKKKKRRKKKKRTKKKRMKKKKGADPAAIYTRSGADRGKTPQFCSVRFCKLIFRRATIFCRARGGPSEKERRGKERRGSRIRARISLAFRLSLPHATDPEISRTARESHEMATLATIARLCRAFSASQSCLFSSSSHAPLSRMIFLCLGSASSLSYVCVSVSDLDPFGSTGSKYRCGATSAR